MSEIALIKKSELLKVEEAPFNTDQINLFLRKTPARFKKTRPAKGGGTWTYVSGAYVKKMLNLAFGWDWDFEIVDEMVNIEAKQVIVKGCLTVRSQGKTIVKMQYGRQDLKFKRNTEQPLDLGNDLKGAATDCLKKCASELGIAQDVYAPDEFREMQIEEEGVQTQERVNESESIARTLAFIEANPWPTVEYAITPEELQNEQIRAAYESKKANA